MKSVLFFISFLCVAQFAFPQFERFEDGPYQSYYKTGEVKTKGQIVNGKFDGKWFDYFLNGLVSKEYEYDNGKLLQYYIEYFEDGSVKKESKKEEDLDIVIGYYESGKLKYKLQYKTGFYKGYNEDESLKIEANYKDFVLNGVWKSYYKNGTIEWEVDYFDGYRNGNYKHYYQNGQLKTEGVILKDKKSGEEKRYTEQGDLEWEGYYDNDLFSKTWTRFDSSNKKVEKIKFKEGVALSLDQMSLIEATEIPDGVREKVPVFPGCEKNFGNRNLKNCMSTKISKFISMKFNTRIASENGLSGRNRVHVIFKISRLGEIYKIRARAPHPALEEEAIRVVKLLPRMQPGYQDGEPVEIPYSLPILFQVN